MSNQPATAEKPVDHFTDAMEFAEKYLTNEVTPEENAKATVGIESNGTLSKYITREVKVPVDELVYEMNLARGVIDVKKDDGNASAQEHSGFVMAIIQHMSFHGYLLDAADFSMVERRTNDNG